jgi:hypothetical protein
MGKLGKLNGEAAPAKLASGVVAPPPPTVSGAMRLEDEADEGFMSSEVRTEVSARSVRSEVLARKTSSRAFWSVRRTPCDPRVYDDPGREYDEEAHLELEHLLKVGEGLAGDDDEVVLDKLVGVLCGNVTGTISY